VSASWTLVTAPTQEPISLTEAKQHAKITQGNDDASLARYIRTARETAEDYMDRALFTQTWLLTLDSFDDVIYLPRAAPLQSVTTVKYYDSNGVQQTLSSTYYTVDVQSRPGRIVRAVSQSWPSVQSQRYVGRIEITYVCGYTTVAAIPERIKQGIRMYVAYMDSDKEGMEDPEKARRAAEACWEDRVRWLPPTCWYATADSY